MLLWLMNLDFAGSGAAEQPVETLSLTVEIRRDLDETVEIARTLDLTVER